jgi:hypothetical protein
MNETPRNRQIPSPDPALAFHLSVVDRLEQLGHQARLEHPGAVSIRIDDSEQVWTGLHGWEYGSVNRYDAENDLWEPVEGPGESIDALRLDDADPDLLDDSAVAEAWHLAILKRREGKAAAREVAKYVAAAQRNLSLAHSAWLSPKEQSDADAYLDRDYPFAMSLDEQVAEMQQWVETIERALA